jgi:hypothetical protein
LVVVLPDAFCLFFVILTLLSLFSYPYSYSLHFPHFSYSTIYCYPSQLLYLPLLIHFLPLSSLPPPRLLQTVTTLQLPPTHSLPAD